MLRAFADAFAAQRPGLLPKPSADARRPAVAARWHS
jgi:hypothetical protein